LNVIEDVSNDITPFHFEAELAEGGAEIGRATASRGIRTACVFVGLFTRAEELDAHIRTAGAVVGKPKRSTLSLFAIGFIGRTGVCVVAAETTTAHALRVHLSDTILCHIHTS